MSKRLQVVMDEGEYERIREVADRRGKTLSAWVREVLREAARETSTGDVEAKRAALREAVRHDHPTGDIEEMLDEIERGYLGEA